MVVVEHKDTGDGDRPCAGTAPAPGRQCARRPAHAALAALMLMATMAIAAGQPPEPRTEEAWHGIVLAERRARITTEIDGRITELPVAAGSRVEKGQDLAIIDVPELAGELARSEAALALARAELDEASAMAGSRRSELDRRKAAGASVSREDLGASQGQYDAAVAREASARARLRGAQAERDLLAVRESRSRIRAPMDGVVGIHQRQVGDGVQHGTLLMELFDDASTLVRFAIPAGQSAGLRIRQRVRVIARDTISAPAHVVALAPSVDPVARLLLAEARLETTAAGLLGHDVRVVPIEESSPEPGDDD